MDKLDKSDFYNIETVIKKMICDFSKLLSVKKKLDNDEPLAENDILPEFLFIRARENDVDQNSDSANEILQDSPPLEVVVAGDPAFLAGALHAIFSTFMATPEISPDVRCEALTGLLLELAQRPDSKMLVVDALKNVNTHIQRQLSPNNNKSESTTAKTTAKENPGDIDQFNMTMPPKDLIH